MSTPDYNLPPHMDQPFVKAWCDMEDDGYQYSDSNVAKVHLGWMMARHVEATQVTALKARVAELEAENDRLSKAVGSGILGELLNDEETDEFVKFIKFLRTGKEPEQ